MVGYSSLQREMCREEVASWLMHRRTPKLARVVLNLKGLIHLGVPECIPRSRRTRATGRWDLWIRLRWQTLDCRDPKELAMIDSSSAIEHDGAGFSCPRAGGRMTVGSLGIVFLRYIAHSPCLKDRQSSRQIVLRHALRPCQCEIIGIRSQGRGGSRRT